MTTVSLDDELLKKKLGLKDPSDVSVSSRYGSNGVNGEDAGVQELSFYDKYGTDSIFGVSETTAGQSYTPTFRTGLDAGASSQGSSLIQDTTSTGVTLADALQMDNISNTTIVTGGTNAQAGVELSTPGGLHQTSGSGYNEPQGDATEANRHNYLNSLGADGNTNILESTPEATGNRFTAFVSTPPANEPAETGEATLTAENPEETEKPAGEGTIGAEEPKETEKPEEEIKAEETEENKEADKPPETEAEINADAEKKAAEEAQRKAQEEAQRRAMEEQKAA